MYVDIVHAKYVYVRMYLHFRNAIGDRYITKKNFSQVIDTYLCNVIIALKR